MDNITLLLAVEGTSLGVEATLMESGGVPGIAIKSPQRIVNLDRLNRLGAFEHNYGGPIFPGEAIQKVINDLEGRTPVNRYRKSPVTHLVYNGAESEQIEDRFFVTFAFTAYKEQREIFF